MKLITLFALMLFTLNTPIPASATSQQFDGGVAGIIELKQGNQVELFFIVSPEYLNDNGTLLTPIKLAVYGEDKQIITVVETWNTSYTVPLTDIPSGNYFLYMEVGSSSFSKMVKW